jgi:hypothetical protein
MFDMTCKELRWYFEDHLRDAEVRCARGAVTEHAATCADCSRFVAEQRELGRSLREMRESAAPVPQSVDTAVLLNYRLHMADQSTRQQVRINRKFRPRLAWSFAAIGVGLLVVVGFLLFSRQRAINTTAHPTAIPTDTVSAREAPKSPAPEVRRPKPKPVKARRVLPSAPERTASLPVRNVRSLPEGFRSLMYCDELSCPQDMEMIRVQLPSSAMPRQVSGFLRTGGSVTADVLVGPDGIARGIRLEEIEF